MGTDLASLGAACQAPLGWLKDSWEAPGRLLACSEPGFELQCLEAHLIGSIRPRWAPLCLWETVMEAKLYIAASPRTRLLCWSQGTCVVSARANVSTALPLAHCGLFFSPASPQPKHWQGQAGLGQQERALGRQWHGDV